MRHKQWIKIIIAMLVPIALFLLLIERRSWRPRPLGPHVGPHAIYDEVKSVAFSSDGKTLAVGDLSSAQVSLWNVETLGVMRSLSGPYRAGGVAFSPTGDVLATAGTQFNGGGFNVWDARAGSIVHAARQDGAFSVAFSPNGRSLAVGGHKLQNHRTIGGTVTLWDTQRWHPKHIINNAQAVHALTFSPDGRTLVTSSKSLTQQPHRRTQKGEVRLWNTESGTTLRALTGGSESAAFSPDGKVLVTAHDDSTVKLWSMPKGIMLRTLKGHGQGVSSVAFSPDRAMIASGSMDGTVRLWDVVRGRQLRRLTGFAGRPVLAFSPDGRTLATSNWNGAVTLWRVK